MRHFTKWMVLVVFSFICVMVAFTFHSQQYRYHDITKQMEDAANIAATKSLDLSVRVEEGKVVLVQDAFEKYFKEEIKKSNIKIDIKKFTFDFLKDKDGSTKAVKTIILDEQNTPYSITYIASVHRN